VLFARGILSIWNRLHIATRVRVSQSCCTSDAFFCSREYVVASVVIPVLPFDIRRVVSAMSAGKIFARRNIRRESRAAMAASWVSRGFSVVARTCFRNSRKGKPRKEGYRK